MNGASHFDLYDNPKYEDKAVQKLTTFLKYYLNSINIIKQNPL